MRMDSRSIRRFRQAIRKGQAIVFVAQLMMVMSVVVIGLLEFSIVAHNMAMERRSVVAALDQTAGYRLYATTSEGLWGEISFGSLQCVFFGTASGSRDGVLYPPYWGGGLWYGSNEFASCMGNSALTSASRVDRIEYQTNPDKIVVNVYYQTRLAAFPGGIDIRDQVVSYRLKRR